MLSHYSQAFILILSFLASFTTFIRPVASFYLRTFTFFLFITLVVEYLGYHLISSTGSNTVLYNFFAVLEFEYYFFILRLIIQNSRVRKIMMHLLWVYLVLAITDIVFIQGIYHFATVTYSLASLLIVMITSYYFFELFQLPRSINLLSDPAFWICFGLLLFYCCSFPIFGLTNFLARATWFNSRTLEVILDLMNIVLYSTFTIALLCSLRMRKFIS